MIEEYKFWREYYNNRWGHRIYEVSNFGNVKCNGKIFEPKIRKCDGYKMIGRYFLHRVVAELFIDNPENKPEIDHIDTNRLNNRVDNLRWATPKENRNNPISKQHMSENHRNISGINNPNYGGLSEEHKRKVSKSLKGRTPWNKNKSWDDETKQKISQSLKGKMSGTNNPMYNRCHKDESKRKMSENHKGTHRIYREDGTWYYGK